MVNALLTVEMVDRSVWELDTTGYQSKMILLIAIMS
jgi:hypothetical protein